MTESEPGFYGEVSAAAFPWSAPDLGQLSPDQSYLGRPVDPEIVSRVRKSLAKYKGPKTVAEQEAIIAAQAGERQRKQKEQSNEYWARIEKVKAEVEPSFKLPPDSLKGKPTQEEYIKKNVKRGLREMRQKSVDYKAWIGDLKTDQAARMSQKVQAKMCADKAFNQGAEDRERERMRRDAEIHDQAVQKSSQYWRWLKDMKEEVKKRPGSAPAIRTCDAEAKAETKKSTENAEARKKASAEYAAWLRTINQAKFELPFHVVVDQEEQERRDAALRQKIEDGKKASAQYFEEVQRMEQKHHDRVMQRLRKKLQADAKYNEGRAAAVNMKKTQMEAKKQMFEEIAANSRQEVKDMYAKVKAKPLFLEVAYSK